MSLLDAIFGPVQQERDLFDLDLPLDSPDPEQRRRAWDCTGRVALAGGGSQSDGSGSLVPLLARLRLRGER